MIVPPPIRPGFFVLHDGQPVPPRLSGAWVAIGNFDGVHRGHRAALGLAMERARAAGRPATALTFEPHPRRYFLPDAPTFRLTPEPVKLRLFAAEGLDGVVVMTFDAELANRTAEDFIAGVLLNRLKISGVVVGDNFHFGKARRGSPAMLREEGARLGFEVEILDRVTWRGKPVSSGEVRAALAEFDPQLVISDLNLPGFSGGEALELVRAHDPALPFVLLTGSAPMALPDPPPAADAILSKDELAKLPELVRRLLAKQSRS